MTFPFERMPREALEHRLHLVAGPPPARPPRLAPADPGDSGTLVFSMLTLEAEDRP